jgi:hypothetical protein
LRTYQRVDYVVLPIIIAHWAVTWLVHRRHRSSALKRQHDAAITGVAIKAGALYGAARTIDAHTLENAQKRFFFRQLDVPGLTLKFKCRFIVHGLPSVPSSVHTTAMRTSALSCPLPL